MAEEAKGRRNRVGTVLITPVVRARRLASPPLDKGDRALPQKKLQHQGPRLSGVTSLPPEDNKLVVLAKATRARTGAAEGAALRDLDGRTYAAATVDLAVAAGLRVGVAIAMAVASGAKGAEAVVVLDRGEVAEATWPLCVTSPARGPGAPGHPGRIGRGHRRDLGIPGRLCRWGVAGSGLSRTRTSWLSLSNQCREVQAGLTVTVSGTTQHQDAVRRLRESYDAIAPGLPGPAGQAHLQPLPPARRGRASPGSTSPASAA